MRDKFGRFVKGEHSSVKTEFKVGQFSGDKHPKWKGGRVRLTNGYIQVYTPGHPRAYRNLVYEHVLVMEKKLGRYLNDKERCHHINGIKDDNREDNLTVCSTNSEHISKHHTPSKLKGRKRDGEGGRWL